MITDNRVQPAAEAQESSKDTSDIALLFLRICDAIGKMHKKGIFHRDINPLNILRDKDAITLCDFGLSVNRQYLVSHYDNIDCGIHEMRAVSRMCSFVPPEKVQLLYTNINMAFKHHYYKARNLARLKTEINRAVNTHLARIEQEAEAAEPEAQPCEQGQAAEAEATIAAQAEPEAQPYEQEQAAEAEAEAEAEVLRLIAQLTGAKDLYALGATLLCVFTIERNVALQQETSTQDADKQWQNAQEDLLAPILKNLKNKDYRKRDLKQAIRVCARCLTLESCISVIEQLSNFSGEAQEIILPVMQEKFSDLTIELETYASSLALEEGKAETVEKLLASVKKLSPGNRNEIFPLREANRLVAVLDQAITGLQAYKNLQQEEKEAIEHFRNARVIAKQLAGEKSLPVSPVMTAAEAAARAAQAAAVLKEAAARAAQAAAVLKEAAAETHSGLRPGKDKRDKKDAISFSTLRFNAATGDGIISVDLPVKDPERDPPAGSFGRVKKVTNLDNPEERLVVKTHTYLKIGDLSFKINPALLSKEYKSEFTAIRDLLKKGENKLAIEGLTNMLANIACGWHPIRPPDDPEAAAQPEADVAEAQAEAAEAAEVETEKSRIMAHAKEESEYIVQEIKQEEQILQKVGQLRGSLEQTTKISDTASVIKYYTLMKDGGISLHDHINEQLEKAAAAKAAAAEAAEAAEAEARAVEVEARAAGKAAVKAVMTQIEQLEQLERKIQVKSTWGTIMFVSSLATCLLPALAPVFLFAACRWQRAREKMYLTQELVQTTDCVGTSSLLEEKLAEAAHYKSLDVSSAGDRVRASFFPVVGAGVAGIVAHYSVFGASLATKAVASAGTLITLMTGHALVAPTALAVIAAGSGVGFCVLGLVGLAIFSIRYGMKKRALKKIEEEAASSSVTPALPRIQAP